LIVDLAPRGKLIIALVALLGAAAVAGAAQAQSMNANSASFNSGYGRYSDQENQAVDTSLRDANGNLVIVDGVIQVGQDNSVFANIGAGGAVDTVSGVGTNSSASAIANNLVVVTEGNDNTVIVNSTQTNSGNVTASSSVSGGVSNEH
jgi:holdfast attachment protein HfaA